MMADAIPLGVQMPDGCRLGMAEAGPADGRPALYFHGTPGSRLEPPPDDDLLEALGIRLIALERPGYGGSTPQPGRRLTDWPAQDMALIASDWGFDVSEVTTPVDLWHGLEDGLTPPSMGLCLAQMLPNGRAHFLPGEGHFLLFPRWLDILTAIPGW